MSSDSAYGDNGLKRCPACNYLNHDNAWECERCPWEFGFEVHSPDPDPDPDPDGPDFRKGVITRIKSSDE